MDNEQMLSVTLEQARFQVAEEIRADADHVRQSNPFAGLVTDDEKDQMILDLLTMADEVERGEQDGNCFIWNRICQYTC